MVDGLSKKMSDLELDTKDVTGDLQNKIDTLNRSVDTQNGCISSCNNICSQVLNKIDGVNVNKEFKV